VQICEKDEAQNGRSLGFIMMELTGEGRACIPAGLTKT